MSDPTPSELAQAWRNATDAEVVRGIASPSDYTAEALGILQAEAHRRGIEAGTIRLPGPFEDSVYLRLMAPVGRFSWANVTFLWRHRLLTACLYGVAIRAAGGAIAPHVPNIHPVLWVALYLAVYTLGLALLCWPLRAYKPTASISAVASLGLYAYSLPSQVTFIRSDVFDPPFIVFAFLAPPIIFWLVPYAALSGVVFLRNRYRPIYPPGHCGRCGYDLQGLPEPRCPECGKPFERQEAQP
jgi:hypothetical protein